MTYLLEARGLTRKFGGVVALDNLDLAVVPNEIIGLIGPNGSGKTTFFNVVTGIYGAHGGSINFDSDRFCCHDTSLGESKFTNKTLDQASKSTASC